MATDEIERRWKELQSRKGKKRTKRGRIPLGKLHYSRITGGWVK